MVGAGCFSFGDSREAERIHSVFGDTCSNFCDDDDDDEDLNPCTRGQ